MKMKREKQVHNRFSSNDYFSTSLGTAEYDPKQQSVTNDYRTL